MDTSYQNPSYLSPEEEPASPHTDLPNKKEYHESVRSQVTKDCTALTEESECARAPPLTATHPDKPRPSDPCQSQQLSESSELTGGQEDESVDTATTERIITEGSIHIVSSTTVSNASEEQQEDKPNQEAHVCDNQET